MGNFIFPHSWLHHSWGKSYPLFLSLLQQLIVLQTLLQGKYLGNRENDLPEKIATKCLDVMPDLDHVEIGLLGNALYMSNVHLRGKFNKPLRETFFQALLTVPTELIGLRFSPLSDLCKLQESSEQGVLLSNYAEFMNRMITRFVSHLNYLFVFS